MANLRIVFDNALDRGTTPVASTTAGSLVAANLQNDFKSQVWRSTVPTATTLATTWTGAAETLSCVALPFSSLSPTATMQVQLYSDVAGTTLLLNTGAVLCSGTATLGIWDFNLTPTGANGYSYGGGSYGCIWFAQTANVRKIVVTLVDAGNALGYIEAARMVIGKHWSPTVNADFGAQLSMVDNSKHSRNDGGDLVTVRASRHKKLTFSLATLSPTERLTAISILRGNGMVRPLYCSLMPETGDRDLEQSYQIYGRLAQISSISTPYFNNYATSMELEEL